MKRNSRPFSTIEREWLTSILRKYASSEQGGWLTTVPFDTECKYNWCDAMDLDNGVLGARPLYGSDIYLAPPPNGRDKETVVRDWIVSLASIAIHELRHMWQQNQFGLVAWSILRLPEVFPLLYGKVVVERDAFAIENEAEKFIASLSASGSL